VDEHPTDAAIAAWALVAEGYRRGLQVIPTWHPDQPGMMRSYRAAVRLAQQPPLALAVELPDLAPATLSPDAASARQAG
jgi:hypothetical protein